VIVRTNRKSKDLTKINPIMLGCWFGCWCYCKKIWASLETFLSKILANIWKWLEIPRKNCSF